MNDLVSIVVPIYKAENFVANLINDVIAQTYQCWELILVSNGDHRAKQKEICQKYTLADKRIRLLISNRKGTSIARNMGVENAKGKWLTFLDADDRISPTHLQFYIDAVADDVDMIIGGFTEYSLNGKEKLYPMESHNSALEGSAFFDYYLSSHTYLQGMVWNKFYKTDILAKSDIRFHEDIVHIEDLVYNYELLIHCSNVKTITMTGYKYIRRNDSTTGRFTPNFENSLRLLGDLHSKICKMAGYSEYKISQIMTKKQYVNTYNCVINLFRPDCPISFGEKVKHLELLLNDKDFKRSRALPNRTEHKMNLRIFDFFVMLGSPLCMSVGYTIIFKIRELYLNLKKKYYLSALFD